MSISVVTFGEKELEIIKNYIPEGVLTGYGLTHIFGAVDGDEIKGFEVIRQTNDYTAVLTWIYVFEEYRKQGIGGCLLDYIAKQIADENDEVDNDDKVLFAEYPADIENVNILDYMLTKRNFDIWQEPLWIGEIGRYQLQNTFLSEQDLDEEFDADIYRLEEVPVSALNNFMDRNEGLMIHDFDIYNADKVLSLVLAHDGEIKGIILITPDQSFGEYIVSHLYVEQSAIVLVVGFLTRALDYLINTDRLIQKLSFLVQEDKPKESIDKVLSNMVIWKELYVKRASLTNDAEI